MPSFANAFYNRGIALRNLGKPEEAIASFNEAFRFGPEFANLFMNRGVAFADCEDYAAALSDLDRALELDGALAAAFRARSAVHRALGNAEKAEADHQEFERLSEL